MIMESMDVDISIVKKERMDLEEDYGNILDNFTSEHDYNDFSSNSTISCKEDEDVTVDWLSSFFDEPTHGNMSGLNPPLSDISDSGTTMTSINCSPDILLEPYSTFSDDYENTISPICNDDDSLDKFTNPTSKISPTICSSSNPFLSQTRPCKRNVLEPSKIEKDQIKVEETVNLNSNKISNDSAVTQPTTQSKAETQQTLNNKPPHQKLLLFMNTPENRAKLAGTNFNIINANLLSKISGQQENNSNNSTNNNNGSNSSNSNIPNSKQSLNLVNLKKCIRMNTTIKSEDNITKSYGDNITASSVNATLQSIMAASQQKEKRVLPIDILNGHSYGITSRKERECQEIDSGYESPTSSSGSSPRSPPLELSDRKDVSNETIQYIDIPPHERQPFYLSEEEKRTLIMEGLPVPQGLPLNKSEERALKKVRRKIKNKISAQESRRKKKEYMESLEKKVDCYATENNILKKKVGSLEVANRSLIIQVQKLQALVAAKISPSSNQSITLQVTSPTKSEPSNDIIDVEQ